LLDMTDKRTCSQLPYLEFSSAAANVFSWGIMKMFLTFSI